jgi:hypothetical protein
MGTLHTLHRHRVCMFPDPSLRFVESMVSTRCISFIVQVRYITGHTGVRIHNPETGNER